MSFVKKNPAIAVGLTITAIFLALCFFRLDVIDKFEFTFYDLMMKFRGDPNASAEVVIVDIDDSSIKKIGRWPWSRSYISKGIEKIDRYKPKVIGLNIIYSEEDDGSSLLKKYESLVTNAIPKNKTTTRFLRTMNEIRTKLDNDRILTDALLSSGKVVLPVFFETGTAIPGDASLENKELIAKSAIRKTTRNDDAGIPTGTNINMPLPQFFHAARGVGHVNLTPDSDGNIRREELLFNYRGFIIPSFTLKLAEIYLNVPENNIKASLGESITLGKHLIPTDKTSAILIDFKGPSGAFERYSWFDVYNNKILPKVFRDKIVLISPSASGVMNLMSTAVGNISIGEYTANVIWAILHQRYIEKPSWGVFARLGITLFFGFVITFLLPRLKAVYAGLTFIFLLALLTGGTIFFFVNQGVWIEAVYPILLLIFGYIGVVTTSFFTTEVRKEKVEGESAETNRMLGLSFQSQGMLDMAFDKFRKAPVDDEMKDNLYNLALDYERKRQFNKAASVFAYIEQHDPNFKDVTKKKEKLLIASESMVYGDGFLSGASVNDDLLTIHSDTRPTLGRYEIVKQLGKGAMGVVYLGQDPRINRTTAIKTFRFSDDFEPEEAEKLKVKFFREAESAGTLSHPNIVTIYDAGEEQDLAYIAMEYLDGNDFMKYTKKKTLLPLRRVIGYIADIAEALDFAHERGVIHRDIKPANIMLLKDGVVKVTDFGIARITATSQTQTGVVKGTPHYMSPEQISGKKVDGRSDIFSLGVMFFQLMTGSLPFKGDSPASLMHSIMNKPHPDPRKLNPKIPKPCTIIINKALEKDRKKRYQKAELMANHLRALGKKMDELQARKNRE